MAVGLTAVVSRCGRRFLTIVTINALDTLEYGKKVEQSIE